MPNSSVIPAVLTIAGSDSGGGAGIQADLKAFARCGVHGMTAITAITAQNTRGVTAVQTIDPEIIISQVKAVVDDIGVNAVKIGMLADTTTIQAVNDALDLLPANTPIVLDPVMIAESGASLLELDARKVLIKKLLPRVTVTTPNVHEAMALAHQSKLQQETSDWQAVAHLSEEEQISLAREVHSLGAKVVVLTGGHTETTSDIFFDGETVTVITGEHYQTQTTHGSGCTHSSLIAAHLALGFDPLQAAIEAKELTSLAVRDGLDSIGQGPGPVNIGGTKVRRSPN